MFGSKKAKVKEAQVSSVDPDLVELNRLWQLELQFMRLGDKNAELITADSRQAQWRKMMDAGKLAHLDGRTNLYWLFFDRSDPD